MSVAWHRRRQPIYSAALMLARGGALALLILALLAVALLTSAVVFSRALGHPAVLVSGNSMGSALAPGTLVLIERVPPEAIDEGDLIVFSDPPDSAHRIHRVIDRQETSSGIAVRTKGDANDSPDTGQYLLPEEVVMPAWTVPHAAYPLLFMRTPLGWILFVALPAVVVFALTMHAVWSGPGQKVRPEGA